MKTQNSVSQKRKHEASEKDVHCSASWILYGGQTRRVSLANQTVTPQSLNQLLVPLAVLEYEIRISIKLISKRKPDVF